MEKLNPCAANPVEIKTSIGLERWFVPAAEMGTGGREMGLKAQCPSDSAATPSVTETVYQAKAKRIARGIMTPERVPVPRPPTQPATRATMDARQYVNGVVILETDGPTNKGCRSGSKVPQCSKVTVDEFGEGVPTNCTNPHEFRTAEDGAWLHWVGGFDSTAS